jgi:hypothetical protein
MVTGASADGRPFIVTRYEKPSASFALSPAGAAVAAVAVAVAVADCSLSDHPPTAGTSPSFNQCSTGRLN